MTYEEVKRYLFEKLAVFQRDGSAAFKKDLSKTKKILAHIGDPQNSFKAVHIAGTNGKGSSAHSIASILISAGYRTGLYTSPHLIDFSERIRINGKVINRSFVIDFVEKHKAVIEEIKPSFFELTVAMAFDYFAVNEVDIAVIETGMGGRLDSTNLVLPEVCLITNIGLDHQQYLGNSLPEIASEKAGIIKHGVPVVIGEKQEAVADVFSSTASDKEAEIFFANEYFQVKFQQRIDEGQTVDVYSKEKIKYSTMMLDTLGSYYLKNLPGVLQVTELLKSKGYEISNEAVFEGLCSVRATTGLMGRWQQLQTKPAMFCDVGHNEDGVKEVLAQINQYSFAQLHFVYGTVKDKEIDGIVEILPKRAKYYLCKPEIARGMPTEMLTEKFEEAGLKYDVYESVREAITSAKRQASSNDFIFVGGSTFVVAEIPSLGYDRNND